MLGIVRVKSHRKLEVIGALDNLKMRNELELQLASLLGLQISQSNLQHLFLFLRVVSLGKHGRVSCGNCIIVPLLCFLFVAHLGFNRLPIERGRESRQQNLTIEREFKRGFEGEILAWVEVGQIDIARGEPTLDRHFDIDLLQRHHVALFSTSAQDAHTSVATAALIADRWKSM